MASADPKRSLEYLQVVNCKKQELNKRGIRSFGEWKNGKVLYIGRDMTKYIPEAVGSKWGNPFKPYQYGDKCVELYEDHIRKTPELWNSLEELLNYREIGCWCKPAVCHGDILLKLLREKIESKKA